MPVLLPGSSWAGTTRSTPSLRTPAHWGARLRTCCTKYSPNSEQFDHPKGRLSGPEHQPRLRSDFTIAARHDGDAKAPRGWLLFGSMGWCHDVSPVVTQWLAANRERFLIRNWTLLIHPDDRPIVRDVAATLQRGELPPPVTVRWLAMHGAIIRTELRMLWRKHADDGTPSAIIGRLTRVLEESVA